MENNPPIPGSENLASQASLPKDLPKPAKPFFKILKFILFIFFVGLVGFLGYQNYQLRQELSVKNEEISKMPFPLPTPVNIDPFPDGANHDPDVIMSGLDFKTKVPAGYKVESFPDDVYLSERVLFVPEEVTFMSGKYGTPPPNNISYIEISRYEILPVEKSDEPLLPVTGSFTNEPYVGEPDNVFVEGLIETETMRCSLYTRGDEGCRFYQVNHQVREKKYLYSFLILFPEDEKEKTEFDSVIETVLNNFSFT